MVTGGFYYGGKFSDLWKYWNRDDFTYINSMKLTSISLCEAILEREAQETRESTDIKWPQHICFDGYPRRGVHSECGYCFGPPE